ncbi:glycoside hydrolase family 70 protein [Ligilactobacillus aviarius]|uniref:glycoside hydrolase family 70 protein n=1 Tax=Ligilactobacillus aviarius TaxID=1606 RepID=UPI0024BBA44E|nr:glycoside hydrolase family 70 protein [Ligilactobacillus aviarius]
MNREVKKRYKMYKAGKNWVVAPIVFLGLTAGLGYQANVKADNVSSSTGSNSENTQQSKANSLSSQSSVALKSSHSAVQAQAASKEEMVNFAVQQPTAKAATSSSKTSVNSNKANQTENQSNATANDAPTANKTDNQTPESGKQNTQDQTKQANDQQNNQPVQGQTQPNTDQQNGQNTADNTAKKDNAVKADASTSSSSSVASSSSSVQSQKVEQAQEHDDAVQVNQNGQWFLQNKDTHQNYTGFQYLKDQNKTVYYNPTDGAMVYGQQKINNQWYYFDKITGAMKLGYYWIAEQQKEVYYDPNKGNMVYGQQKINGHWQYFDDVTGVQAKSKYVWIGNQNKEVYYDGLGNMAYGQQKINGKWQWFDTVTGAQAKNQYVWIANQNKEVYYDGLGNMVYGQQRINGHWQWFDTVTGAQAKNQFVTIKDQNKVVYYDGVGNMVYGWQKINGGNYYFDTVTGALETYSGDELPATLDSSSINEIDGYLTYDGWFRPTQYHQDGKMWVKSGVTDWRPILMYAWPSSAVEAQYIQYFVNHGYSDESLGLTADNVKALSGNTPVDILNNYARNMRDSIEKQIYKDNYSTKQLADTMKGFIATVPDFTRADLDPVDLLPGYKPGIFGPDKQNQVKFVNNDSNNQTVGNTSYADSLWRLMCRNVFNQNGSQGNHPDNMEMYVGNDIDNSNPIVQAENLNWEYFLTHYGSIHSNNPDGNFDGFRVDSASNMDNDVLDQMAQLFNDMYHTKETDANADAHLIYDEVWDPTYAKWLKSKGYENLYYDTQMYYSNVNALGNKPGQRGSLDELINNPVVNRANDTTEDQAVPNWSFVMNHDQRADIIKQMIMDEHPDDPSVMGNGYKEAYAQQALDAFFKDQASTNKQYAHYNMPLQYAILLTDKDTIPTVYYGDLYKEDAPYMQVKGMYYDAITTLLKLRKMYVSGGQQMKTYDNGSVLSSVRFGKGVMSANDTSSDPIARTSGIAVVISNNPSLGQQTITFSMGKEHANQKYINVMNTTDSGLSYNSGDVLTTDANGNLTVTLKGYSNPYVSGYLGVWVPEGAAADQDATTAPSTAKNTSGDTYQSNAALDSHVIYQDFSLYIPNTTKDALNTDTYAQIAKNASLFKDLGITNFWFAPPYRNFTMSWYNEGYSLTDRYDLGSASDPTKYGSGDQLVEAIAALHKIGIHCDVDLVPNQMVGLSGEEIVSASRVDDNGYPTMINGKTFSDELIPMYTKGGGKGQEQYGGAFLNYLKETYPDLFTTKAVSTGVAPDPNVKIKQWSAKYENGATIQDLGPGLIMKNANGDYDYLNSDGNTKFKTTLPAQFTDSDYWIKNSAQPGWHTYGNGRYYIYANGTMAVGTQTIDGKSYTFDSNSGKLISINGAPTDGERLVDGHWQYFDPATGKQAKNQYVWLGDLAKEVYYDGNGNMVYGQQMINGHWQYFDPVTGAQVKSQYQWIQNQNKWVYYDGLGNMVYGQQMINGHWQYFDPVTGAQAKSQYVWIGNQNKWVYYDGLGDMVYGLQQIDGKLQYFDPVTGAQARNQYVWLADRNGEFYFDKMGNMVYGQQMINGHWQYFDPTFGNQVKSQYVWIDNEHKEVYYNGLGNMVYGWQTINGQKQYFDPTTGAQAKNVTLTIDGQPHSFDMYGNLVRSQYVWVNSENKEVYYDANGNMVRGWQTIDGHKQYFDPTTGAQVKSATITIDGKQYTFDGIGDLVD